MAPDERLPRGRRIRKRKNFLRIQGKGRKYGSEHFLLAIVSGKGSEKLGANCKSPLVRLGITVTTKVDKHAVKRNTLKRRVREYMRRARASFTSSVDLVVISRSGATELSYKEIAAQLTGLLRTARLIKTDA